jgi:hypothetical protein
MTLASAELQNRTGRSRRHVGQLWQHRALPAILLLASTLLLSGCSGLVTAGGTKSQPAQQAAIQVTPSSFNFGNLVVGKKISQTATIANTGNTSINVTAVAVSSGQFSLSGLTMPLSLPTGQSSTFQVWFDPSAAGNVTATLTVQTDNGVSPGQVALTGVATVAPPQISVSSTSLNLGSTTVGATANGSLTLANPGGANLIIALISVSGSPFGVSGISTPSTIVPGGSVNMNVSFSPTTAGGDSGSITVTSNDPQTPTAIITLAGSGTSSPVVPTITTQPASQTVTAGQTATFAVVAAGTAPLGYQWQKNGANIVGATAANYTTPVTATSDSGSTFRVVVSNTAGTVTGAAATLTVTTTAVVPIITTQPTSQTVTSGQTATFTVVASGTAPLSYQWQKNGANIAGATAANYTTPVTATSDSASTFAVVVSNTAGTVTSAAATLTVNAAGVAPTIATQPASQTVTAGQAATFTVVASGTAPLSYQWQKNGTNISGATAASYTTPATATSDSGSTFRVMVNNTTGSVTSAAATLTVNPAPVPGIQVSSSPINFGNDAIGSISSQALILTNTGTATLTITQVTETGAAFSVSGFSLPLNVNVGQHTTITVAFQPTAVGAVSGNVSIVSNAPSSPTAVGLTGTGIAATLSLGISPASLSFGNVTTGTTSASQDVTITNTGNANVTISQISVSGAGYTATGGGTPVTLSPTQTLALVTQFSPTVAGSVSGSISVASSAIGSPATVSLSGTGIAPVQHSVALSWTASTSTVSGYNVYRGTASGGPYTRINSSLVGTLSYTDSTVQSSTTYYYVTTAVDSSGNESAYSNEVPASIP